MYKEYVDKIKEEHYREPWGIHGIPHVKRVLYLAEKISSHYDLTEEEEQILALAVCYHDIGRVHNEVDPEHGQLSCRKIVSLGLLENENLLLGEKDLIFRLIKAHCLDDSAFEGTDREELLFYILKDADGLDRVRIFDLDPFYLRCYESKELTELAWKLLFDKQWEKSI